MMITRCQPRQRFRPVGPWAWCTLMLLLAGGCGITSRQAQIRQWIGRSESELIAEWGQPTRIERNRHGQKVLVYEWTTERWEEEEGTMWTDSSGVTHWTAPRSRRVTTVEVRRFVVDENGRIVRGSWAFY